MTRLNAGTLAHHMEQSDIQLPIPVTTAFLPLLLNALPGASRVFLAALHGEAIGFGLVLDSGDASHASRMWGSIMRARSRHARNFNLYYAVITDAIPSSRGAADLDMGAQAYTIKRKLRAIASPTVYHFEVTNPVLRRIAALVARNFAAQEGSQIAQTASAGHRAGKSAGDVT